MSRQQRRKGMWPLDAVARNAWHMAALTDDIVALVEVCETAANPDTKFALVTKILVDLKSFDELVKEFRKDLYKSPGLNVPEEIALELKDALRVYDATMEGSRALLAKIRHNLGAHRRGLPGLDELKSFKNDLEAWGSWERALHELEAECTLERWIDQLNAAIQLRSIVSTRGLGAWRTTDGTREYLPLWRSK